MKVIDQLMERHERRISDVRERWRQTMSLIEDVLVKRQRVIAERVRAWGAASLDVRGDAW